MTSLSNCPNLSEKSNRHLALQNKDISNCLKVAIFCITAKGTCFGIGQNSHQILASCFPLCLFSLEISMNRPTSLFTSSVDTAKKAYNAVITFAQSPQGKKAISMMLTVATYLLEKKTGPGPKKAAFMVKSANKLLHQKI